MSVFAISDLHLSTLTSTNKSMEVFGRRWEGYMTRLENNWRRVVTDRDTVIVPGDISWAISLDEARSDLKFLDSLPGKKILGKGNHDFWWTSMKKHREFFVENEISSIEFLYNNALDLGDFIAAGTRGWFFDEDAMTAKNGADFEKILNREVLRLKASLDEAKRLSDAAGGKEIIAFMHFPPYRAGRAVEPFIDLLLEYGITRVYFGHIHGAYSDPPKESYRGIDFTIISADYLSFIPKIITKE